MDAESKKHVLYNTNLGKLVEINAMMRGTGFNADSRTGF